MSHSASWNAKKGKQTQRGLSATVEREGWKYEVTLKKEFGAWVPVKVEADPSNLRTHVRTALKYQKLLIDGTEVPFPQEILVTKELRRETGLVPYIIFRKVIDQVKQVSPEELKEWMSLDILPNLSEETLKRLSGQKQ